MHPKARRGLDLGERARTASVLRVEQLQGPPLLSLIQNRQRPKARTVVVAGRLPRKGLYVVGMLASCVGPFDGWCCLDAPILNPVTLLASTVRFGRTRFAARGVDMLHPHDLAEAHEDERAARRACCGQVPPQLAHSPR